MDYSGAFAPGILKQAGLSAKDVELSIQLAHQLAEAVKMRRAQIHEELSPAEGAELEERERREQADDDRIYLGAALFLARKMKPNARK